ncbi:SGNH/GDSL hydrolase family protein [Mucilaginibacter sp. X5P1]|uniref:SGNH/GDSL hydrolase family protein n=1 Tax=Mucilaginibacter sp. X5P1 TaxID=2723088 RepID=UPI001622A892|nr:SGNH/GDSL hydrolase family protein [Mucilaginibacter sp. X5P1]MBB6138920.1 lysophospholipase L1-like esterase [Mucilaginibacter sp. X5P1]
MKVLQIILISLTTLFGCKKNEAKPSVYTVTDNVNPVKAMTTDSITYLALGDSYTIGQSVPQAESYPYQLTASLSAEGFKTRNPDIIAITGWTTDDLIDAIAASTFKSKQYSFVTLLIGVNDQYQGMSQANYTIKFAQVLNTAISYAQGDPNRVFVLSIPDYGVTPFADGNDAVIGPQIDQFNAINAAISAKAGVHYLNITAISRLAAKDPLLIASDGLHPSGLMYTQWVSMLEPLVATQLNKK